MTILKHQIVVHPDLAGPFASERSITPYERQDGFSWYLCPVVVADKSEWLLVNAEFGYCRLANASEKASSYVEQALLNAIESHLSDDRDEYSVSVSLNPGDITWHTADKMPEHVGLRYQQVLQRIRSFKDRWDAIDEIERLNDTPLNIGGRTFAPTEGLEGLLLELADDFRHYIETTPWWKQQWHIWKKKVTWLK